jgi:hypothetical protein
LAGAPIRKFPAGIATISGQFGQSRNTRPGVNRRGRLCIWGLVRNAKKNQCCRTESSRTHMASAYLSGLRHSAARVVCKSNLAPSEH